MVNGSLSILKTLQIRALINDNEDVKMNQEELNANMAGVNHQASLSQVAS